MLIKRQCPHTGVVNFYSRAEPHFAVGSIVPGDDHHFTWRYHTEPYTRAGQADDMPSAERELREIGRIASSALASSAKERIARPC